ncbi:hypothetical protein CapIbe_016241 [Capra ibex]
MASGWGLEAPIPPLLGSIKQHLRSHSASPMDLLSSFKQLVAATRTVVHVALGLLEEKLQLQASRSFSVAGTLEWKKLRLLSKASDCAPQEEAENCSNQYRTITGRRNKRRPWRGVSNQPLVCWLPAENEDRLSLPFGWTPARDATACPSLLSRLSPTRPCTSAARG